MAVDFTPTLAWLSQASLNAMPLELVLDGLCERLNEAGAGIARGALSAATLHPSVRAFNLEWRPGKPSVRENMPHGQAETPAWHRSPLHHMLTNNLTYLRQTLDRPNDPLAFPVFDEFAAEGMTDYIASAEGFGWFSDYVPGGQFGILASWTTKRPGGFREEDAAALHLMTSPLALAVKSAFMDTIAHDVLGAYLGADAAARVLSGAITRGGVTQLPAAVMMADIKGFTRFSNTRPIADVVKLLNDSFDMLARAVEDHGGHILKFVGDGALAIFLLEGREASDVAARALAAAQAIQSRLPDGVAMDIGLNIGDVHYGNVGAAGRLDFTAIGPAVNEAARLEALCQQLGHRILVSGAMAEAAPPDWRTRLAPLGRHPIRGWDDPRPVFALA